MFKVGIIGFGGIAQAAHTPGWERLKKQGYAELVAATDIDPEQFNKKLEINIRSAAEDVEINAYSDIEDMLKNEDLDIIDICVPTPNHAEIAVNMLSRGYHVFCEKPMARSFQACQEMINAAEKSNKKIMIGQCVRFSSEYLFLKQCITENTYGAPVSAMFRRMSAPPVWASQNWYMNHEKSGGCLLDMHIHDVDIIRFLFGNPKAVSCVTQDIYSKDDLAHSRFFYDDMAVFAIGDWSQEGTEFTADFRVGFENATVILDGGKLTVYPRGGEAFVPTLPTVDMYHKELEYFVTEILKGKPNTQNTPESAAETVKLVELLKKSADSKGMILAV